MTAYAVGHLTQVDFGENIVKYIKRIDMTLEPFGGKFLVHGGPVERLEGDWKGDLIVVAFPDKERARDWYHSDAYQAILPLRTGNSTGTVILIDGVPDDYREVDKLE